LIIFEKKSKKMYLQTSNNYGSADVLWLSAICEIKEKSFKKTVFSDKLDKTILNVSSSSRCEKNVVTKNWRINKNKNCDKKFVT